MSPVGGDARQPSRRAATTPGRRGCHAACGVGAVLIVSWMIAVATRPEPPRFTDVRASHRASDVALLDRDGAVLQVLRTDARVRRFEWTPLAAISPALSRALIAAEDRRFAAHGGVDLRAVAAAIVQRLRGGPPRGASTLAMQLAARVDPTLASAAGRRTLWQKWRQMRLARAITRAWTPEDIVEAHLNLVPFRGEVSGIAAASWLLAGKAPHGLTDPEALTLAALLRAPNARPDAIAVRARRLADAASIVADVEAIEAASRRVGDAAARRRIAGGLAPHLARRMLHGATAPVRTTLAADVQRVAVDAVRRNLLDLAGENVEDAAVLAVDNGTGDVIAYVGGSGTPSHARFVDTVRARRQPGSTLKPFLYALAFERRVLTPASLLEDRPLEIAVAGGVYRPRDYDEQFRGDVTARTALASSLNVPAVRTLGLVGGDAFVDRLRALGLAGVVESGDYYGPALALGAAEVSLWELVGAYRALANGGAWSPLRTAVEPSSRPTVRVVHAAAAFLVADILADREARSAVFGLESALATPYWTAVKTGTSKEMRDNWCVGWSEQYTVGVWVGNAGGAAMHDVSGASGAAPVWLEVMSFLHRVTPSAPPAPPTGVTAATIRFARADEPPRPEWFLVGTEPRDGDQRLAAATARVVTPVEGTILVLDPDIPADRQRVILEARDGAAARWRVDGEDLGSATELRVWEPRAGTHTASLVDPDGAVVDGVTFEVRGPLARRASVAP